ncbi:Putative Flp pilus-assembly TadE/G-like [Clostridium cavendishii DSM 21758]|uniref:Putative Flp pilus-assembly TadE/G-like n=1 Tax=Clostridium cavendishii DSM 21758 TaxID=1121302 RepID=A0A1M6FDW7_9CLOT|nr:pilus assembly protein TadG-related protein [Clostridium cavendishii]SHI95930.1 Putative Flp pilus-assembly TadE/G-like [Clostridium cavendishii DSM 21758]
MRKLDNKGNISIILCLLVTALFGFTAYVIDIGMLYVEKIKLSNAIDSAALAAALELPNDYIKSKSIAIEYLSKNNVDPNKAKVIISSDYKSIQISAVKNVNHIFASMIGIGNSEVNAKTKAIVAPIKSIKGGIRPLAVENYNFSYGDLVTLKEGAGDGYHGNYGVVALGGSGANVFRGNALYGYSGTISVGDYIDTEPGNIAGVCNDIKNFINSENSTFNNFPRSSIRLWTIPLVDSLVLDGKKSVLVVGFAEFYVENVNNRAGNIEINGRFIKYVLNSEVDENLSDTGAYGAKLSK